jgi:predicted DNA-binding helix-hairpin-helix protein
MFDRIETRLETMTSEMQLETAEEKQLLTPPAPSKPITQAFERAPCGNSPAQLKRIYEENTQQALTSLDKKRNSLGVYHAAMPGGQHITLLKTMLTSACERDCFYCPFRAGRSSMKRVTFKSEEMAQVFTEMTRTKFAEGLFLSSGIIGGGVKTQDKLIDTVEILRRKQRFSGYIHLKLMPGAERDQIERAMMHSSRVSINLEAPNAKRLSALAPKKHFENELLRPLLIAHQIRQAQPYKKWASTVTQFVVGAAGESDVEILSMTERLHKQAGLTRAYFSAFSPVRDTPLENAPAEDPWREHRLYQSSFLLRDYGFELEELPFGNDGHLPLATDPKIAWARTHLADHPIEINRADKQQLLRVPGIGPKSVELIIKARRDQTIRQLKDLRTLGIIAERAAPFVLLDGRQYAVEQLRLF